MKRKPINSFKVINWDFNADNIEFYDIIPYLFETYKKLETKKRPKEFNDVKEWIQREAQYQFWSRCEYEVIVTGWPKQKREVKIDVFGQIMQNIDVVTETFMKNI